MPELTDKEKAWEKLKTSQKRFNIGMIIALGVIGLPTLAIALFFGEDSIPHIWRVWIPIIMIGIMAISWIQTAFAGNEVISQYK